MSKISLREAELTKSKNLNVRAIPEIVDIIKKSRAVSICKGKSHFLLRSVVKRKSKKKAELEEKKEKEQREYVSELKGKIQQYELENEEAIENREKLSRLYELGVINSDGEANEFRHQE